MKLTLKSNNSQYLDKMYDSVAVMSLELTRPIKCTKERDEDRKKTLSISAETPKETYLIPTIVGGRDVLNIYRPYAEDDSTYYEIDCSNSIEEFVYAIQLLKSSMLLFNKEYPDRDRLTYDYSTWTISGTIPDSFTVALTVKKFADEANTIRGENITGVNMMFLNNYIKKLRDNDCDTFGDRNFDGDYADEDEVIPYDVPEILFKYFGIPLEEGIDG